MTLREKKLEQRRAKIAKLFDERGDETKESFMLRMAKRFRIGRNTVFRDLKAIAEQRKSEAELLERIQSEGY